MCIRDRFYLVNRKLQALNALRRVRFSYYIFHWKPWILLGPLLLLHFYPKCLIKHLPVPQSTIYGILVYPIYGILVYPRHNLLSCSCQSKIFKLPVCSFTVLDILDQGFFHHCCSFMGELATSRLLHVCCHLGLVTNPNENTSQVGYDCWWSELCVWKTSKFTTSRLKVAMS